VLPVGPEIAWAFANRSFAGAPVCRALTLEAHASAIASATKSVPRRNLTYEL
jgi:hypothetical protein